MLIFSGIVLAFLAFFMTSESQALYCYECRSLEPCVQVEECALANPSYMETFRRMYFPNDRTDYSDPKNLPKPVCLTSVILGHDGVAQTRRECSPLGNRLTCEVPKADATRLQGTLHTCKVCDKDFCNDMTIENVPNNTPIIPPYPGTQIVFTRPPVDTASPAPDHEQESSVPSDVNPHNTRSTPGPAHRSTPRSSMPSGSSSHYAVIVSTYVLACLALVLQ